MNDAIISAREIVKSYDGKAGDLLAVNGVSLDISPGESIAIVGPSGAGKSTLLHMLGGLDRPTSGKVFLEGSDLYGMSDAGRARARNRKIGFIFQSYHLLPEFTALENVLMPAFIGRSSLVVHSSSIKEKAESILGSVGLGDRIHHRPGELSGGESQRVAIARALVNDPQVLLCDEPTGNLDSKNREAIYVLLSGLKLHRGVSIVVVTHDEGVSRNFDRIIHIKDGRTV